MVKRVVGIACVVAVVAVLLGMILPGTASAQDPTTSILAKLVDGLSPGQQADVIARNGGVEISSIPGLRLHVVQVAIADLTAVMSRYQADSQVQHVEENKVRVAESIPSDPLYLNQWALPRIGWDQVFGAVTPVGTATVALLDTGVDARHPDLAGLVRPGISLLDGSDGMTDPSGHGTWLAGIVAARTDSQPIEGIAGVGYAGVEVVPVTVLNAAGEGLDGDVIAGVIWAADHGADVILMAFSNPGFSQNLQDAIDYAWSKGAVVVAAVGNTASADPTFPAGDRGVMGVAATDPTDSLAYFSNAGQAVFIAAPGVEIQTTAIGDAYEIVSGTSTSAAIVAGAAALMKAVDPSLTNGIIVGRLARSADPAGTQSQTGNGRINLPRALADTSTEPVQPAGAVPVGDGGPFVGPYVAAVVANVAITSPAAPVTITSLPASVTIGFNYSSCCAPPTSATGEVLGLSGAAATKTVVTGASIATILTDNIVVPIPATVANGTYNIKVTVTNDDGTGAKNKNDVKNGRVVINVPTNSPPTVARNLATVTVNEGATANNTGTWSDPNAGDTVTLTASVGTVIKAGTNAAGTWTWSFATTDGPTQTQTVTITADDGQGGVTTTTFTLNVNNVAPAVTAAANQTADEATSKSFDLGSFTDPGADSPWAVDVDWGDGTPHTTFNALNTGSLTGQTHTYADNGSFTVTVKVTDKDGASDFRMFRVTVVNKPPVVTAPGGQNADEGMSKSFDLGSFTDAGPDSPWTVDVNWGDGSAPTSFTLGTTGSLGTQSHTYSDNGTYTVTVTVTDKDGGSGSATFTVAVANKPPVVTAAANQTADEGTPKSFSLGGFTDPGVNDNPWSVDVNWGDGAPHTTFSQATMGSLGTQAHAYADNGTYTVTITVTDKDGGFDSKAFQVTVSNLPPVVTPPTSQTAFEGTSTGFSLGGFTDPGVNDNPWSVDVNWGDGSPNTTFTVTALGSLGTRAHTYDDNGTYTVTIKVADKDGGNGSTTFVVTVANVAPTATLNVPALPVILGSTFTLSLTSPFDPSSADTAAGFTYQFDCGDGTFSAPSSSNTRSCAASSIGTKTVRGRILDKDGGYSEFQAQVSVIFDFRGFFQPVDNLPVVNIVKAGSAIPVKFSLTGYQGLGIFASGYPKVQQIACSDMAPQAAIEETVAAGNSSLQYDPGSDQYIYVWKTEKQWAGTCRRLNVRLVDGTEHYANFSMK